MTYCAEVTSTEVSQSKQRSLDTKWLSKREIWRKTRKRDGWEILQKRKGQRNISGEKKGF